MFDVAFRAFRGKCLGSLMDRRVVAGETGFVAGLRTPEAGLLMAGLAIVANELVGVGDRPGVIGRLASQNCPPNPNQADRSEGDRKHAPPVRDRKRLLEISPVNSLGEFFS